MRRQIFIVLSMIFTYCAAADAITYDVALDTAQEVPAPTIDGSTPSGMATVDVNTLDGSVSVTGTYTGMTSDVSASHLHGLAPAGSATGVILPLTATGGTAGTFGGPGTLSAMELDGLLDGLTYLNVHTANNGPGEIRGQVVDSDIQVFRIGLDAMQAVPSPVLNGDSPSGSATVVVDTSTGEVEITGSYTGTTSDVTAAHLHGLAPPGEAVGVIFGLTATGGTSGTLSGSGTLDAMQLTGLLAGETYVNVHTVNNGPGEIRGQVPEPSTMTIALLGAVLGLSFARRRCRSRRC